MPIMPQDRLALDAASVRTTDADGHLHIADSVISRAEVNGYRGSEIPDYQTLGLDASRIYQLWRDPAELSKAAPTFNAKPLTIVHRPQTAADHSREVTVGAVNNVYWKAPDLRAELVAWDAEAILGIDSEELRDLSCGYRYTAVMEPGEIDGVAYDGRMTNIIGNHVALVAEGRVSGAIVGDSALQQETSTMATSAALSRPALLASGAIRAYLRPKLAADGKIDLAPMLATVSKKSWPADRPKLKLALDAAVKGKLAKDANLSDVDGLLDDVQAAINELADEPAADPDAETDEEKAARLAKRAADKTAADVDETPEEKKAREDKEAAVKTASDALLKTMVSKPAMDAAIKLAVDKTRADTETATIARLRSIQEAERNVRPYVGEVIIAQDSAAAVYKFALDKLGVDVADVDPSAFRAVLMAQPVPGGANPHPRPRMAQDSADAEARFRAQYPEAVKLIRS